MVVFHSIVRFGAVVSAFATTGNAFSGLDDGGIGRRGENSTSPGSGSGNGSGSGGAPQCPPVRNLTGMPIGQCPQDFDVIGPSLQAVHESATAPTGFAVDPVHNIYITYPRNSGPTPNNVVIAASFTGERPWPSAEIQNCSAQALKSDASRCFVNVQNVVLDSRGVMWAVDSGIPAGQKSAVPGGAKIMSFGLGSKGNGSSPGAGNLIRTYPCPIALTANGMNANDVRINNTVGRGGFAYLTDESPEGSLLTVDLDSGAWTRRLFNTTYTRADPGYVGVYDGRPNYAWKGSNKSYVSTGSDGLALQSGQVFWSVFASRRWYYVDQKLLANASASDAEIQRGIVFPGQVATEQAGMTADDRGRVYICASEHNAIFYADTLQSEVKQVINGVGPGGKGLVKPENYYVKTLVRSAQIQHADSAAILDGWLYFSTNQLELSPGFQYNNTDNRRGPFRSYRTWIGRGPAV